MNSKKVFSKIGNINFFINVGGRYELIDLPFEFKLVSSRSRAISKLKSSNYDAETSLKLYELEKYAIKKHNLNEEEYRKHIVGLRVKFSDYFEEKMKNNILDIFTERYLKDLIYIEHLILTLVWALYFLEEEDIKEIPFFYQLYTILNKGYLPCDWRKEMFHVY